MQLTDPLYMSLPLANSKELVNFLATPHMFLGAVWYKVFGTNQPNRSRNKSLCQKRNSVQLKAERVWMGGRTVLRSYVLGFASALRFLRSQNIHAVQKSFG